MHAAREIMRKRTHVNYEDLDAYEEMHQKKKQSHADEFRSRLERTKILKYPESDEFSIIVKSSKGGYGYQIDKTELRKFGRRLPLS